MLLLAIFEHDNKINEIINSIKCDSVSHNINIINTTQRAHISKEKKNIIRKVQALKLDN